MKKELWYMVYFHLVLLVFIVYTMFDLMALTIDTTFKDALTSTDLNPPSTAVQHAQLIPKIIHQTYKTEEIPEHWKDGQRKCIELHPDYKYFLWTDQKSRQFIQEEYPWFLETFDNYKYPIQRADAIRYFVLSHFGGIYIDLDDGCERRLDPLLTVPAFVRKTSPTGVSNDVMGSVPRHPFFLKVLESLKRYDNNWVIPYLTIMLSTGPLFISLIWKQYKRWGVPENGVVRILLPSDYKMHETSFFAISEGSSWHLGDAHFIKSLADYIPLCVVVGFVIAFIIMYAEYRLLCWLITGGAWSRFYNSVIYSLGLSRSRTGNENVELGQFRRLRKDSNLPTKICISDIEKQDPKFTDLSHC
ncbi:mannosylinositol phosphorylceramide synthase catalytic subunit CSH1 [Kluyveromyces lactis]|uniref:inositol phosphorylceramide mannosyltransferase n=1 Tax=Kluyveromyces lactis (strain ATCC 8585 / CBS 2359 / DSM 70799 / NBRC 1267 / NRRL Y-1140 / WM37) TaxID=284590 RepID=Q6CVS6_KLULA|nr:uncharacterized protein KLLA0_B09768g [Kluyveromyces lactis]CAH02356.1 KLLA0B09768p [Kluyveromyces lactis]|eukprot:XP_451963.1 uncharacterized protein KLLA0_B09768g [Kluyveromyces lactis]